MSAPYTMITTPAGLADLMAALQSPAVVGLPLAIDTEADSMHHYREKVCLLQLTVDGRNWIIDPLADLDLEPLIRLLEERDLLLHGADYDLRLLGRAWRFRPRRVFDTMLAAQLLGWEQFGLAALVRELCAVELPKDFQRADWSRRPLPETLLDYAAADTHYLPRVAAELRRRLEKKGRLPWHAETCARLLEATARVRPDEGEPAPDAWRIKGGKHFTGRAAAVLRELWLWRERTARRLDLPPFKIAGADLLLEQARWAAAHPEGGYERTPKRPAWLRGARERSFEAALRRAWELPPDEFPDPPRARTGERMSPAEELLLRRAAARRDEVAARLEISPGVLAPRESLKALVRRRFELDFDADELPPLMRWQSECLREPIRRVLSDPPNHTDD